MAQTFVLTTGSAIVCGVTLSSITSIQVDESSNVSTLSTDGAKSVQAIFVDSKTMTVTINTSDVSALKSSSLRNGKNGAATIKGKLRGVGDAMIATDITWTIGEVVITANSSTLPSEGIGSGSLTFQAYDSSGDDSLFSVA